jgi:hypothetical protein
MGSLCEPESVGQLLLRESCLLTQSVEALTERVAFVFGWSAGFHVANINQLFFE